MKSKKSQNRRSKLRFGAMGLPVAIAAVTVLGLAAAVVIANLSSAGPEDTQIRELDKVGHDVEAATYGPDIHFASRGVDFGAVPLNKEVSYAFSFANVGSETLRIDDVQVRVIEGC